MYLASCVTGKAKIVPRTGLMNPSKAEINPIGNTSDTAPIVIKFVIGEIRETCPKCIAVSGIVKIIAPVVVVKLDTVKFTAAFGTVFL